MFNDHLLCHSTGGVFPNKTTTTFKSSPHDWIFVTNFCYSFCIWSSFLLPLVPLLLLFSPLHLVLRFSTFFSCSLFPALLELSFSTQSCHFDWFWESSPLNVFFLYFKGSFYCCSLLHNPIHQFRHLHWHVPVFCLLHICLLFSL